MDFTLDDDAIALREAVRRFAERAVPPHERAKAPTPAQHQAWRQGMAELGLFGLCVDADQGGLGLGAVEAMLVAQALGEALIDGAWLATAMATAPWLARDASAPVRSRWLPALMQGHAVAALACLEPGGRFDTRRVATRATRLPDVGAAGCTPGWRLDGVKAHVLSGDEADLFLVVARTDADSARTDRLSVFAVPADVPGLTREAHATVDGRAAATIRLKGVVVGDEALIGGVGTAATALDEAVRRAEAAQCAEAAGTLDALLEMTAEHLRTRRQFGQPLATLQAVQHRMADLAIIREQALSMACAAAMASLADDPGQALRVHAGAKVLVAQGARRVALDAIQLHGAMGMTDECAASRYARRLLGVSAWWGDEAHHLAHLSRPPRPPAAPSAGPH